jgi:hypothetical protein
MASSKPKSPINIITKKGVFFKKLFKSKQYEIGSNIDIKTEEDLVDRVRLLHLTKEELCYLVRRADKSGWRGIDSTKLIDFVKKVKGISCEKDLVQNAKSLCDKLKLGLSVEKAQKLVVLAKNIVCKKKVTKGFPYKSQSAMCKLLSKQNWVVPVIPHKLSGKYKFKDDNQEAIIKSWQTIGGCDAYVNMEPKDLISKIEKCKADKQTKKLKEKEACKARKKCDSDSDSDCSSSDSDCSSSSDSDSDCDKKKKKKKKKKCSSDSLVSDCSDSTSATCSTEATCSTDNTSCTQSSDCSSISPKTEKTAECTESEVMKAIDPCEVMGSKLICEAAIKKNRFCKIWTSKKDLKNTSKNAMDRAFRKCKEDGGCTESKAIDIARKCADKQSRRKSRR